MNNGILAQPSRIIPVPYELVGNYPNIIRMPMSLGFNPVYDPDNLVLVFDTTKEPQNLTISVPIGGASPNCIIDWGDGTFQRETTGGFKTKTYANHGIYIVQIRGTLRTFSYGTGAATTSNKTKLIGCLSFGKTGLTNLSSGFFNCTNLIMCPNSLPSSITDLSNCFYGCSSFNDYAITRWNTSSVTTMHSMFRGTTVFNKPIGVWDTSSVTSISYMFYGSGFNSPINSWNVSKVGDMQWVFVYSAFNQPLGDWNVSSVGSMQNLFFAAGPGYNYDISNWDIRRVTNMASFMNGASWGTTNYSNALINWANLPDDPLLTISLTGFTADATYGSSYTRITTPASPGAPGPGTKIVISGNATYNGEYIVVQTWSGTLFTIFKTFAGGGTATGTLYRARNVTANFGTNKYSAGSAATARGVLTGTYNWTITDGGQA